MRYGHRPTEVKGQPCSATYMALLTSAVVPCGLACAANMHLNGQLPPFAPVISADEINELDRAVQVGERARGCDQAAGAEPRRQARRAEVHQRQIGWERQGRQWRCGDSARAAQPPFARGHAGVQPRVESYLRPEPVEFVLLTLSCGLCTGQHPDLMVPRWGSVQGAHRQACHGARWSGCPATPPKCRTQPLEETLLHPDIMNPVTPQAAHGGYTNGSAQHQARPAKPKSGGSSGSRLKKLTGGAPKGRSFRCQQFLLR